MQSSDTQPVSPTEIQAKTVSRRKLGLLLFLGALLLLLGWLGVKAYRIGTAVQSLLAQQAEIETLLGGGLTQMNPEEAEEVVMGVRQDVVTLRRETAVFMPLTPYLGWLPKVGPVLLVAPELMEMADAGTETAVYAFNGLKPALALLQAAESGGSQMSALVQIVDEAEPDLILAKQSLARLVAARQALGDTSALPWRLRTLLEQADPLLPLAQDGLQAALVLPQLMGMDGPRSYLIIAQNEDEIRPTGGFITGAGLLQVANGRITSLSFQDANLIDNWQEKPYDFPPQPYYDLMGLELFLYRDANFWPDFPTSAEAAVRLYRYGQDAPELDGAIAIDQKFVQYLLQAIGPVTVAESGQTLTSKNVIQHFQEAWAKPEEQVLQDWHEGRKSFMGMFGQAIQAKIESGLGALDPLLLVKTLHTAAEEKHVQLYMRDPEVAAVFDALNWDGRLENPTGQDVLAVIDTNMGYNKVNIYVERTLNYEVMLSGNPQAHLSIHYNNQAPIEPGEAGCYQGTLADYSHAPQYLELADECYWNYVRVYAPGGSQLISSTTHLVPAETQYRGQGWHSAAQNLNEFTGWQTFANFLLVPQQETVSTAFSYTLPTAVVQIEDGVSEYQLFINRQAGTRPETVHITVQLPPGATVLQTNPASATVAGNTLTFNLSVARDTLITIRYTEGTG
jgi:hypothetical protein